MIKVICLTPLVDVVSDNIAAALPFHGTCPIRLVLQAIRGRQPESEALNNLPSVSRMGISSVSLQSRDKLPQRRVKGCFFDAALAKVEDLCPITCPFFQYPACP